MAKKVLMKNLAWCETKVWSDNQTTVKIIGSNSKGTRVELEIDKLPTYMLTHIADEIAQALVKVRGRVQKDIDIVKQSLA